jgi:uncharacterized repeat protein (TIGR03803 family)
MSKLKSSWWKTACAVAALCASTAIATRAQSFTTLHSFDGTDGSLPYAGLVQATNGNLYGTTSWGGANGQGTVFKITASGTLTTLHSFCKQSGCAIDPLGGLVQATNGNFFGTTFLGGGNVVGTVFEITPSGTLGTRHSFSNAEGADPAAALVQASDGNLYGTTENGANGYGTLFKITPGGALTTLYVFCSQGGCTDGEHPTGALVQATNGNFYGTTQLGGTNGSGTIFSITPGGTLATLHSFDSTDGDLPAAGLVQGTDGTFYGTTVAGGPNDSCNSFGIGCGTVFKITPGGKLTTLYNFCSQSGCTDGAEPYAALVQASDGDFYGATYDGGANVNDTICPDGCGTVFKITPTGTLTTLYSFCSQGGCTDGANPYAALVQDTSGNLYGTTTIGGTNGEGTIFSLSLGLGPFVETQPTSGKAGAGVRILGTSLTGATSVTFNGTPATFTVASPSLIITTVPAGATTGPVQVTTPSGTLTSNVNFRVRQ